MSYKYTSYNSNFKVMLKKSEIFVDFLIEKFHEKEIDVLKCDDKRFDLIASNGTTYEVKVDGNAFIYGRTGVEIESWGKPAGIASTEADYYIVFFPVLNYVVTVHTDVIRILMEQNSFKLFNVGDKKNTVMALWNFDYFINSCREISNQRFCQFQIQRLSKFDMPQYDDETLGYLINKYKTIKCSFNQKVRMRNEPGLQAFYNYVDKQIFEQELNPSYQQRF